MFWVTHTPIIYIYFLCQRSIFIKFVGRVLCEPEKHPFNFGVGLSHRQNNRLQIEQQTIVPSKPGYLPGTRYHLIKCRMTEICALWVSVFKSKAIDKRMHDCSVHFIQFVLAFIYTEQCSNGKNVLCQTEIFLDRYNPLVID